jgi:hypothetical protein
LDLFSLATDGLASLSIGTLAARGTGAGSLGRVGCRSLRFAMETPYDVLTADELGMHELDGDVPA